MRLGTTFFVFFLCIATPFLTHAASIVAKSPSPLGVGDAFIVPILLDTEGDSINAIEGTLTYPSNVLKLREIRDGNTTVSLWVERPAEQTPGVIRFAGIIPGGYQGLSGEIMTVVFEARAAGFVRLGLNGGKAYRNDGTGLSSGMSLRSAAFDIGKSGSGVQIASLTEKDTTAPEPFTPVVSSDPAFLEGKRFIVFATQDKESGLDHYEVAERQGFRFLFFQKLHWQSATSPFTLSDQTEGSYMYVKAVDRAGNSIVVRLSPVHPPFYYSDTFLVAILLVLVGVVFWYVRKRGKL